MAQDLGKVRAKQTMIVWGVIFVGYLIVWLIPAFGNFSGKAPGAEHAASILRDTGTFKWYLVFCLVVILNTYTEEIRNQNWAAVFAGVGFITIEAFNEIWNGLWFTATGGYSAVWMCAFDTAYELLIGWNAEIICTFLIAGIMGIKLLPEDKNMLFFGKINNRHVIAFGMAVFCVCIEIVLYWWGGLVWNFWWWKPSFPWLLILIGYLPFWEFTYFVYDLPTVKDQAKVVGAMAILIGIAFAVFIPLGWI
jgi:hypothetical protein